MQGVATAQQQAVQATEGPLTLRERVEKVPTGPRVKEAISVKAQIIFDTSWKRMEARLENVRDRVCSAPPRSPPGRPTRVLLARRRTALR
jgi:hypothetical protein